jgi:hypothetical protein
MALPENSAERLRAAASLVPTNSPAAHVPLMWFLRCPACAPNVPSKASIICGAVMSLPAAGAAAEANKGTLVITDASDTHAIRVQRQDEDVFMMGDLPAGCRGFDRF